MLRGALAKFTGTPRYVPGMRAYDLTYFPPDETGDFDVVITHGNQTIRQQISDEVFAKHPHVTDYTFRELDYMAFQERVARDKLQRAAHLMIGINMRQMNITEIVTD